MAYYLTGDYYRGDYYRRRGDPFLGISLGGITRTLGGIAKGVLTGGIPGAVIGGISSILKGSPTAPVAPSSAPVVLPSPSRTIGGVTLPAPAMTMKEGLIQRTLAGPRSAEGVSAPGMHLDKATKSYLVRNRSMNPANPRALRRAIRREKSFIKLARSVLRGTGVSIGRRSFASKKSGRR